jgi:DNA-binding CsgD family transcriptional regulator/tetratricopeptide (TPR) repeat protein
LDEEIIGREHEFSVIRGFTADPGEYPAALLIEGEPGIGKSILWRRAIDEAGSYRRVLSSRPTAAEAELSFAVLNDLLDPVLGEDVPSLMTPRRRALERALLRAEASDRPATPEGVAFGALDVLRAAAQTQPVLVAIDDSHWIDPPSAGVLRFVFRRLEREPVAILLTARPSTSPDGLGPIDSVSRTGRIELGPLSLGAVHRLVLTRVGVSLPRHVISALHEQSGGNPFYALEIARGLIRQGLQLGPHEPLPIPDSLSELVSERIGSLSAQTQQMLVWASAMPNPSTAALQIVAGSDAFDEQLGEAVDAGILELDGQHVRFAHPILASAVYARMDANERLRIHGELATSTADSEEKARHLALATDVEDETVAALVVDGARRAAKRGAPGSAAALYEQALRVTPSGSPEKANECALAAIDLHLEAGEMLRASEIAGRMMAVSQPGPWRASFLYRQAVIQGRMYSLGAEEQLLLEAVSQAGSEPRIQAEVEHELAWVAVVANGDIGEAVEHASRSLAWAERAQDPRLLAMALVGLAGHAFLHGEGFRHDLFQRARDIEKSTGIDVDRPAKLVTWGLLLACADEFDAGRARLEARYQHALEIGEASFLPFYLYQLSELELWTGNWDLADQYADEAIREARLAESPWLLPAALYSRAQIDAHLGRTDVARAGAEEAVDTEIGSASVTLEVERDGLWGAVMAKTVLGFIDLSLGNFVGAHEHLKELPARLARMGAREPGYPRYLADAIEARIGIGDLDAAATTLADFEEMGRAVERPWALATSARCRGLLQAANGDLEGATASLARAMIEHRRLAMPFELGRSLMVQGVIHRRSKRKRAAKDSLESALEIFEQLGASLWAGKARAELGRIGIRGPASSTLTAAEERVAELVAVGQTNREVADALFMSVKTVDSHLSKIYRKLNVRSRTELARVYGRAEHSGSPEVSSSG